MCLFKTWLVLSTCSTFFLSAPYICVQWRPPSDNIVTTDDPKDDPTEDDPMVDLGDATAIVSNCFGLSIETDKSLGIESKLDQNP